MPTAHGRHFQQSRNQLVKMTRDRLAQLIKHPSSSDQESISALEEIVARFPYYTNGHILLTVQYRLLDHIRYDSQLRKTSVYVPDRAVLRRLVLTEEDVPFPNGEEFSAEPLAKAETVEEITPVVDEKKPLDTAVIDKPIEKTEVQIVDTKLDPREVIEQRLKELKQQEQLVRDQLIENTSLETPIIVPIKGSDTADTEFGVDVSIPTQSIKNEVPQEPVAPIDLAEIEPAVDAIQPVASISEPTNEPEQIDKPIEKSQPRSFSDWLKVLPAGSTELLNNDAPKSGAPIETSGDYFENDPANSADTKNKSVQKESIIDKFIREEPRIVPSKSEFYSPGNMARKSAQDHEDLISETLARIYAQQGNIAKAITTYERLALKLPQKKAYFASLIEKLLSGS